MEKIIDNNDFFKVRSYVSCLKNGFQFLSCNPKNLVLSLLPYTIICAVVMTLYCGYYSFSNLYLRMGIIPSKMLIMIIILYVLSFLATSMFVGQLFNVFKHYIEEKNIQYLSLRKSFKASLIIGLRSMIFNIWVFILAAPFNNLIAYVAKFIPKFHSTFILVILGIAAIAILIGIIICAISLIQSFYTYLLDGGSFLKSLSKSYSYGYRHKGKLFGVTILSSMIVALILFIVMIPVLVSFSAVISNQLSMLLMGDPSGMPIYAYYFIAIAVTICIVIMYYVLIAIYSSLLYAYGSIIKQEEERENIKMTI
jgi:hypothetical protein